jgi:regulation of enolase protein 1 (concanavalin A-like superfamily)/Na+-transporting methylmalonyl-CoA/oxaloacetate decarboxylase gamma subunit
MTSLSDSQNIDVDRNSGNSSPQLPPGSPLQACPHCEALVDITEREPLEVVECPGCGQPFAISGQIEHYQIIDIAGKGGMGVVYKAYDPRLDRYIALKLLKKNKSNDAQLIQQLETEAAITASITDPNVVRVFGTGRDRDRFFIAMELVDKGSLDDLIRLQGRVAEVQVLQVGIQIASGLKAAQQHNLIHRDVKPGNILFADAQTSKIVDFGLAIFMEHEESVRGEIWGTPYYVAPEKLDQEPEDFRSDMYSLAATLFHALAGRPPFEAENASMVALKHLKSQAVSLQAFAPWVSNPTAHIINRSLSKNPQDRFQSYDELIHNFGYALEQLHEHGNAPQKRARVVLETEEDRKTWTWVVLGMGAVMVILMVVFFTMWHKGNTTQETRETATVPKEKPTEAVKEVKYAILDKPLTAMANRDKNAMEEFRTVLDTAQLSPTDRAWAQYLEALAGLATNRTLEGKSAFLRVEPFAARVKDAALGKFLTETAARLAKGERISTVDAANFNPNNYEAIGLLAYGLMNWQIGQHDDSVALLKKFRQAQPAAPDSWILALKPLSNSIVDEFTAFQMEIDQFIAAKSPDERVAIAKSLQAHSPTLSARAELVIRPYAKEIDALRTSYVRLPEQAVYRVVNKKSGKILDVSGFNMGNAGIVHQHENFGQSNQMFELSPSSPGFYRLQAFHSTTAIDVPWGRNDEGLELHTWTENNSNPQKWAIEPQGDGWFKLRAQVNGKVMSIQNQSTDSAAKIVQTTDSGAQDQYWKFERVGKKLTDGWYAMSIGDPHAADKAEYNNGVFKLTDQGADIWAKADKGNFVCRPALGDFDLVVRVLSVEKTDPYTKAGLIVRPSLLPDRMNVATFYLAGRMVSHQRRPSLGADSTSVKIEGQDSPHWLKMERRGDKFTSFHSTDGQDWQEIASDTLKIHPQTLIGITVTSHNASKSATAEFDNLTYTKK